MALLQHLQRIMDLPNPLEEANKKLIDTYMLVNGEIMLVKEFHLPTDQVGYYCPEIDSMQLVKVNSLEIFLPEPGLYELNGGGFVYLNKIPKRQWHKSYRSNNYMTMPYGDVKERTKNYVYFFLKENRKDILVSSDKRIFFHDKVIGFIKNSFEIVCTNLTYKQELKDWIRDAN